LKLDDNKINNRDIVRIEAYPMPDGESRAKRTILTDPSTWRIEIDEQETLPTWFKIEKYQQRIERAIKEIINLIRLENNGRGLDLTGANLKETNLAGVDFTNAILKCANLYGADLSVCDFTNADLRGANLYYTMREGAEFTGANVNNTVLAL
jgi:hypothetical protein